MTGYANRPEDDRRTAAVLLAILDGLGEIRGGCHDCEATQEVVGEARHVRRLTVTHQEQCPHLSAARRDAERTRRLGLQDD